MKNSMFLFGFTIILSFIQITKQQVQGPYIFSFGTGMSHAQVSSDGNIMMISYPALKVRIYSNTGTNFTERQLIENVIASHLDMVQNASLFFLSSGDVARIYEDSGNFTYS